MSILNSKIVIDWLKDRKQVGEIVPILGPPPVGMFSDDWEDAPTEMILGYRFPSRNMEIHYEFSPNTQYLDNIDYPEITTEEGV